MVRATAAELIIYGVVVHLACDWLLQNTWMAEHKHKLYHPAGYVHAGIHTLGLLLVFPPAWALFVGTTHLLIDTRKPLQWWARIISQSDDSERVTLHLKIWRDQVAHVAIIAAVSLLVA